MPKWPPISPYSSGYPVGGFLRALPITDPPLKWEVEEGNEKLEPIIITLNNRDRYNSYSIVTENTSNSLIVLGLYNLEEENEILVGSVLALPNQMSKSKYPICDLFTFKTLKIKPFFSTECTESGVLTCKIAEDGNVLACNEPPTALIFVIDDKGKFAPNATVEVIDLKDVRHTDDIIEDDTDGEAKTDGKKANGGDGVSTITTNNFGFGIMKDLQCGLTLFGARLTPPFYTQHDVINGDNLVIIANIKFGHIEGTVTYKEIDAPLFNGQLLLLKQKDEMIAVYTLDVKDGEIQGKQENIKKGKYFLQYKYQKQTVKDEVITRVMTNKITRINRVLDVPRLNFSCYGYTKIASMENKYPNITISLIAGDSAIITETATDGRGDATFKGLIPHKSDPLYHISAKIDNVTFNSDTFKLNLSEDIPPEIKIEIKPGALECVTLLNDESTKCEYAVYNENGGIVSSVESPDGRLHIPLMSSHVFGVYKVKVKCEGLSEIKEQEVTIHSDKTRHVDFTFTKQKGGFIEGKVAYDAEGAIAYNGTLRLKNSTGDWYEYAIKNGEIIAKTIITVGEYKVTYDDTMHEEEDSDSIVIEDGKTFTINKTNVKTPYINVDTGIVQPRDYIRYPKLTIRLRDITGDTDTESETDENSCCSFKLQPLKCLMGFYLIATVDGKEYKTDKLYIRVDKEGIKAKINVGSCVLNCVTLMKGTPLTATYYLYNSNISKESLLELSDQTTEVDIPVATSSIWGDYKVVSKNLQGKIIEKVASVYCDKPAKLTFDFAETKELKMGEAEKVESIFIENKSENTDKGVERIEAVDTESIIIKKKGNESKKVKESENLNEAMKIGNADQVESLYEKINEVNEINENKESTEAKKSEMGE